LVMSHGRARSWRTERGRCMTACFEDQVEWYIWLGSPDLGDCVKEVLGVRVQAWRWWQRFLVFDDLGRGAVVSV